MNNFIISEQQVNKILDTLGEFPAKATYDSISILLGLQKIEEKKEEKVDDPVTE